MLDFKNYSNCWTNETQTLCSFLSSPSSPEPPFLYPLPVLISIAVTWSTVILRKLRSGPPSLWSRGVVCPRLHSSRAPEISYIQRFWCPGPGERVSDLWQSEQPSTLVEFSAEEPSFFQCSRLNYYSQRELFISSDTAGSFLGKQLYCCVRLTQTVVICNKDKKIALVS